MITPTGVAMEKVMTINQIKKRYKSEWILLSDPKLVKGEVVGGKVAYHSKDRDKLYQKAVELKLPRTAFLYTGTLPKDMAIVL
jgi:hypothetical protein